MQLERLKKRPEFLRVAAAGNKAVAKSLVLQYVPHPSPSPKTARVGFTVTKRQGNAVVRNRIRRRLRAAFAEVGPGLARSGFDYVVIGRKAAFDRPFDKLLGDLRYCLHQSHPTR